MGCLAMSCDHLLGERVHHGGKCVGSGLKLTVRYLGLLHPTRINLKPVVFLARWQDADMERTVAAV
jgi:hypothetical protein